MTGSSRADVLASIRRSLGVNGREAPRRMAVEDRLERAPKGLIPQRGQLTGPALAALFRQMAEGAQASVAEVDSPSEVPQAVAAYLRQQNLPAVVRMGDDLRLKAMPWQSTALELTAGPSEGHDAVSVSHAYAGVAETGTVVMTSGRENPTTLNFLPDSHIVVVNAKDICGDYEETWAKLRRSFGKGEMPRTVNWITGPSRSADIEQTLLLGAHGPRSLHLVIVGA